MIANGNPHVSPWSQPVPRPARGNAPGALDGRQDGPGWSTMSLDEALSRCGALVEDASYPTVERWRQAGGKVVGHFQVYFPEELAHAAGALPVKLRGAQVDARDADPRFGSYLCSILKTSLQLALGGNLALDLFVTHPICDAARNLGAIWGRNVDYPCHILYLPQNPNSGYAADYLRGEYRRILDVIEDVTGSTVTDDDLRASIGVFNENRHWIRELYRIRRETPWNLSVDESYVLMTAGAILPREEHNELLAHAVEEIGARDERAQDRLRVVFQGGFCEQPPLDLLKVIGRSCYVVDDDLMVGLRWLTRDVSTDGDPLLALARAYIDTDAYSPVQHDLRKPKEKMLLAAMERSGANAAILTSAKMCEPGLEEQVTYSRTLDEQGVPYFVSEFEESMSSFDHLEIQLETFVERLLFA